MEQLVVAFLDPVILASKEGLREEIASTNIGWLLHGRTFIGDRALLFLPCCLQLGKLVSLVAPCFVLLLQ